MNSVLHDLLIHSYTIYECVRQSTNECVSADECRNTYFTDCKNFEGRDILITIA